MDDITEESSKLNFKCPVCGSVTRDDVIFLCNKCDQSEMINMEGVYMCPSCLEPGKNFECMKCGSKDVVMEIEKQSLSNQ